MRSLLRLSLRYAAPLVLFPLAALIAYAPSLGCGSSDDTSTDDTTDAGPDAVAEQQSDGNVLGTGPVDADVEDASVVCQLDDQGDDPVALCTQKTVLQAWKAGARLTSGVSAAWSVSTGLPVADGGALVRDVHAELAYGAAIANYHLAATCYGDTTITFKLDADLLALEPTILADFATLPAEYAGDTYFHLRRVAAGLRYMNQASDGDAVDAIAEAYGAAIAQKYFLDRGAEVPVVGDAGTGADAGDAGDGGDAGDAGTLDAGGGTGAGDAGAGLDDGIIGSISGGVATYTTVDSATAALALLDLASRHTTDSANQAAAYERMAVEALDHLYLHARDTSGFFYAGGSTSSDGGSGDVPSDAPGANGYTFTSDVQGRVAEIFLQAADLAAANTALPLAGSYPFTTEAETIFKVLLGTPSLYDSTSQGFFASLTPATGTVDKTKTMVSNAALFGFLGDERLLGTSTAGTASQEYVELAGGDLGDGGVASGILYNTYPNRGFLGLFLGQNAYVPLSTATFASVPASDANYTSRDTSAVLDALARQLPASCGQ
jgi:hypothetical protein